MFRTSSSACGSRGAAVRAASIALSLLVLPAAAMAGEIGVAIEPGVAFPLTSPQSDRFDLGGGGAAKLLFGLMPALDLTAGVSAIVLPGASGSSSETGTAWGYGGGLRLKRPHGADTRVSPWLDGDALYVRTGSLNRFGFAAGLGVALPVGAARNLWVGPYVRYQQIMGRGEGAAVDGRDAKVLLAGLSVEFGRGPKARPVAQAPAAAPAPVVAVVTPPAVEKPDRDADGTPDESDLCPDVSGPSATQGCPRYEKVVVKPDKLELKEKIQFAWDSPVIDPASHPALDEAVKALQDNRGFRVQIEGHASSEGGDEHNQTLSEARAKAVLDYLASHGVAQERLGSKGFSSSVPVGSNTTAAGREANRRVEFVVHLVIVKSGSGK